MKKLLFAGLLAGLIGCCGNNNTQSPDYEINDTYMWKNDLTSMLPLMGHRNWILVVDQAYPWQSAQGLMVIDTKEPIEQVLPEVLSAVDSAKHIKPIIYTDLELNYLDEAICPGVTPVREALTAALKEYPVNTIPHEQVFPRIDEASKLFQIIVLKTTSHIAYSSVFIELDCGYWNDTSEKALRARMAK